MCFTQGHNTVKPVRFEPTTPHSQIIHSTTEPLHSLSLLGGIWDFFHLCFNLFNTHIKIRPIKTVTLGHWTPTIYMSRDMRFPTMWYVQWAKPQTSLHIHADWSEPLLVAWIFHDCKATDQTAFGVSKLKRRLHSLVWVYICRNTTLLEITCGSIMYNKE